MIVVPSLADRHDRQQLIVRRFDGTVKRFVAPRMRGTVHQPRVVQRHKVAHCRHVERRPAGLAKYDAHHQVRHEEREQYHQLDVVSLLEHAHRIPFNVAHIDAGALLLHQRMLAHHQPSHVRKEEATRKVVRIGVRVGVLVMHAMVAHPFPHAILERHRLHHNEQTAQRQLGLVRAVRPQPMRARRDANRADQTVEVGCAEFEYIFEILEMT